MPRNKLGLWRESLGWLNFLSIERQQYVFDENILASPQILRNDDREIISKANQTFVKSAIVNGRQAKPIAWVEPVCLVAAPRNNVAGDQ